MRVPDSKKFENDRGAAVSMTPYSIHDAERPKGVFAEQIVGPSGSKPDAVSKVRGIYIEKEDFHTCGFTHVVANGADRP